VRRGGEAVLAPPQRQAAASGARGGGVKHEVVCERTPMEKSARGGENEICTRLAEPFSFLSLSHAHAKDQQEQSMSLLHLASFRPRNSNDMMTSEAWCSSSSCHQQPEIKVSSSIALTPENNIYLGWQQLVWWQKLSLIIISISAFFAKASYDHTRFQ
jgi:hypothetical protein